MQSVVAWVLPEGVLWGIAGLLLGVVGWRVWRWQDQRARRWLLTLPIPALLLDRQGRVRAFNTLACQQLQCALQPGQSLHDRFSEPDWAGCYATAQHSGFSVALGEGRPHLSAWSARRVLLLWPTQDNPAVLEQLRESRDQFTRLVNNLPGVVYCYDLDTHETRFISDGVRSLSGYTAATLLDNGRGNYFHNIHPEHRERVQALWQEAHQQGGSYAVRYPLAQRDGSWRWVEERAQIQTDALSGHRLIDAVLFDISAEKAAQDELQEARNHLERITNALPGCVFEFVVHGTDDLASLELSYLSSGIETLFEIPRERVLENPRRLLKPVHAEDRQRMIELFGACVRAAQPYVDEYRLELPSGERWIRVEAQLQRDPEIEAMRCVGYLVDISSRRAMEQMLLEREQHFRALHDGVSVGLLSLDRQQRITQANPAICRLVGRTVEQLKGRSVADLFTDAEGWLALMAQEIEQGRGLEAQTLCCPGRDGMTHWLSVAVTFIRDERGHYLFTSLVCNDVTEARLLSEQTERARLAADEANRAKSDFLANMSHEIRTPMNAIIGLTHLCLQEPLAERAENFLHKIESASQSLLHIINDILDFSKIEAGKLEMELRPFRLEEVFDGLSDLFGKTAADKGLELLFSLDPTLPQQFQGDPLRLGQVLTNLVGNALKFTAQGEVVVKVRGRPKGDRWHLLFKVNDSGCGLSEESCQRLFTPFVQADSSTTRRYGGTGLGLAISRRLVELMGGRIGVSSRLGEGSCFWFTIDVAADRPVQPQPLQELEGMKVLVVDDNPTAREVLGCTLENFGMTVEQACSGAEAISSIAETAGAAFDLMLLDWRMPDMDGLQTLRELQSRSVALPPVVMVSAYGREELLKESQNLGVAGLLLKPVSPSLLLDTVLSALRHQGVVPLRRSGGATLQEPNLKGLCVLLVEDNPLNCEVAIALLERAQLAVEVAHDGAQALARCSAEPERFDLILMDCQMPVMDGFEATRQLRAKGCTRPIIAMTANAMAGDRERCLAAGMDEHLSKPIDVSGLYRMLLRYLSDADPGVVEPALLAPTQELPCFDQRGALARLQGDEELFRRLVGHFVERSVQEQAQIEQAWEAPETLAVLLHTLKGLAGTFGLLRLQHGCQQLELQLPASPDEAARAQWRDLYRCSLEALQAYLLLSARTDSEQSDEGVSHDDAEQWQRLRHALCDADAEATAIVQQLRPTPLARQAGGDFQRLERAIRDYDFDQALEQLEALLARHEVT